MQADDWGLTVRPQLPETALAAYTERATLIAAKDSEKGIARGREAAAQTGDATIAAWWLWKAGNGRTVAQVGQSGAVDQKALDAVGASPGK
jgi:hypothetical protein